MKNIRLVDKGSYCEVWDNNSYQMNIRCYWLESEEDIIARYEKEVKRLDEEDEEEL